MAKKSRRGKRKGQPARLSSAQMVQPGAGEMTNGPFGAASGHPAPQAPDLQDEYRYVIADLRRIGIIAMVMLALLVALALLFT